LFNLILQNWLIILAGVGANWVKRADLGVKQA